LLVSTSDHDPCRHITHPMSRRPLLKLKSEQKYRTGVKSGVG
jgi:hypothetical protein